MDHPARPLHINVIGYADSYKEEIIELLLTQLDPGRLLNLIALNLWPMK